MAPVDCVCERGGGGGGGGKRVCVCLCIERIYIVHKE